MRKPWDCRNGLANGQPSTRARSFRLIVKGKSTDRLIIAVRLTVRGIVESSASSTRKRSYLIRVLMWLYPLSPFRNSKLRTLVTPRFQLKKEVFNYRQF